MNMASENEKERSKKFKQREQNKINNQCKDYI